MRNGLTESNGIHIVIEDNNKSPSILSNGISIRSGTETNIGLKITNISRLQSPYSSECTDTYQWEALNSMKFLKYFQYSSKNCKSWCYITIIQEACDCFDLSLMEGIVVDEFANWSKAANLTLCEQRIGSSDSDCVKDVLNSEHQQFLTDRCKCHAECREIEYKVR